MMRRRVNTPSSGMNLASQLNLVLLRMLQTETGWQNSYDLKRMEYMLTVLFFLYKIVPFREKMNDSLWFLFYSTKSEGKLTSLDQYISRMRPGQKDIFYLTGTSKEELEKSPFLERLLKKNYEV